MPFLTRIPRVSLRGRTESAPPALVEMDPHLATVARAARAIAPDTRLGMAAEILRMSPYRTLAVVENEILVGVLTETALLTVLLGAADAEIRSRAREMPVRAVMEPPVTVATPAMRVSEAAALFAGTGLDSLPVVDYSGVYLGMVARSDLVQDLVRPFRPPTVGGMATPLGVYLTTGSVSGGAGTLALLTTGFFMFLVHLVATGISQSGLLWIDRFAGSALSEAHWNQIGSALLYVFQLALFLVLLRLSPVAGYHAAEHQVVHALERSEPLLVDAVRRMPRVHPRCGTNLVAGMMIVGLTWTLLSPLAPIGTEGALPLGFILAITYWRTVGGWLQQHFTTRPATDKQIESGIAAARELLEAHGRAPYAPGRPIARLWRMGFPQIMGGFALGYGLLFAIAALLPARLEQQVAPWLNQMLAW